MTTLQRSSYSFRRQGSSGRIWDNRLPGREIKIGCEPEANRAADHDKFQENISIHNEMDIHSSPSPVIGITSAPETEVNCVVGRAPSRSGNKVQKCAIGAIFGRCAKPATAS
ncbi:hypothetical protein ACH5RR_011132 [Cinchona calisaya]|uniref:Uncharacterized protein n=1 Tax=Cinchona calisaya TaxID=153742 RepID=A0ABD3A404_9GENT